MNARMCEQTFGRTNMYADRQTDGRTDSNTRPHARVHANTRMYALMNAGLYDQTGRTDGRTDSHKRPHAHVHAHTRTVACLHAHTMHSGKYARTDRHTHTCSYGGKHPSTNMEVRSKKLEIRNAAHALMNARMCEQTFGRTDMHAAR